MRSSLAPLEQHGQVVVITGSTRGFGRAAALALAAQGARVLVHGRDAAAVQRVRAQIQRRGGVAAGVSADLGSASGAQRVLRAALRAFGRVDVWISNAALVDPVPGPPWQADAAALRAVLRTNLEGCLWCGRELGRWARAQAARPWLVHISSGAGERAVAGAAAYVASKHGVEGLTRALAADAGPDGMTVTALQLPMLRTGMTRARSSAAEHRQLPAPETAVPALLALLGADPRAVHGRSFAAWRLQDPAGDELLLTGPLAGLGALGAWAARRPSLDAGPEAIVLERLENPFGPAPAARAALQRFAQDGALERYPDEHQQGLRSALAAALDCDPRRLSFGAGSIDLVERVLRLFVRRGEVAVCSDPTWFFFGRLAAAHGVQCLGIPLALDWEAGSVDFALPRVLEAVRQGARLIYLVNPSNPLGAVIPRQALQALVSELPPHVPLIVDEAYAEFAAPDSSLFAPELFGRGRGKVVIALRTFSKFHGLAGQRVGYAVCSNQRVGALLSTLEIPYGVTAASAAAAQAAIEDRAHAARLQSVFAAERARCERWLRSCGLPFLHSHASFIPVRLPVDPDALLDALQAQAIYLPRSIYFGDCILLPVARPDQNDRLWRALEQALETLRGARSGRARAHA